MDAFDSSKIGDASLRDANDIVLNLLLFPTWPCIHINLVCSIHSFIHSFIHPARKEKKQKNQDVR